MIQTGSRRGSYSRKFTIESAVGKKITAEHVTRNGFAPVESVVVGVVGHMDGGTAEVPRVVLWGPGHDGEVENRGVAPDIEVEFDPEQVRKGRDPQLEAAVQSVMAALRKHPSPGLRRLPYREGDRGPAPPRGENGFANSASTARR